MTTPTTDIVVKRLYVGNDKIANDIVQQVVYMTDENVEDLDDLQDAVIPHLREYMNEHLDEWKIENYKVFANTINNPTPNKLPLFITIQYKRELGAFPTILEFTINSISDEVVADTDRFSAWKC